MLATIYALVIMFAFPFADLAKMRQLQRQTSAPARLSAYRFIVVVLIDAQVLWMYRPADDAPDQARLMIHGCEPT